MYFVMSYYRVRIEPELLTRVRQPVECTSLRNVIELGLNLNYSHVCDSQLNVLRYVML